MGPAGSKNRNLQVSAMCLRKTFGGQQYDLCGFATVWLGLPSFGHQAALRALQWARRVIELVGASKVVGSAGRTWAMESCHPKRGWATSMLVVLAAFDVLVETVCLARMGCYCWTTMASSGTKAAATQAQRQPPRLQQRSCLVQVQAAMRRMCSAEERAQKEGTAR